MADGIEPSSNGGSTDTPLVETAPPGRRHPTRTTRRRVLRVAGAVVAFGLLAGLAVAGYGWYRYRQIDRKDLALTHDPGGVQNYLIVGSDNRGVVSGGDADAGAFLSGDAEGGGERSDTVMVARVDPRANTVDLLSFPRDLWVPIAGTDGRERINTAFALGGPQRLIDTLQADFGIPINHYVEIDFHSFKGIVDAVGGVPMYFDTAMRDANSGLSIEGAGCVTLDSDQALAFSRARHLQYRDGSGRWRDDPTGDLGRINRQQTFIRRVIDRAQAKVSGVDVIALNRIVGSTVTNLSIDSGLSLDSMVSLVRSFKNFGGDQVRTWSLPVTPYTTRGGASVLQLDEDEAQEVLDVFRGHAAGEFPLSEVHLEVANGSGVAGAAQETSDALRSIGFTVEGDPGTTSSTASTTVRYATGSKRSAQELVRHLRGGAVLVEDPLLGGGKVKLILGADFEGVSRDPATPTDSTATSVGSHAYDTTTTINPTSEPVGVVPESPPDGVSCG